MHTFTLNVITSSRKEIVVQKDRDSRSVRVTGFDPEGVYFAEDAKELAELFAGVEKMLKG